MLRVEYKIGSEYYTKSVVKSFFKKKVYLNSNRIILLSKEQETAVLTGENIKGIIFTKPKKSYDDTINEAIIGLVGIACFMVVIYELFFANNF